MKKGNSMIMIGIVSACVITAVVIVYGILSLTLSPYMKEKEEFDALANVDVLSLEDVVFQLESSSYIGSLRLNRGKVDISIAGNGININITGRDFTYSNTFTFDNNILSVELFNDEKNDDITISILEEIYSMNYDNKEVLRKYLEETNPELYSLDSAGIESKDSKIRLKTNKKIEYIDFSLISLTIDEITQYESKLKREGFTTISNSNISMIKSGHDGEVVISIAQCNKITEATFKSLVNVLAVMYDYEGFYKDFIDAHPTSKIVDENKNSYKVQVNPEKESYEKENFGDKPMVRVTIY